MCVAIACTKELPTLATLRMCEDANGDGGGIAWLHEGLVRWKKNLKAKEIIDLIEDEHIQSPALIHFRIATAGGKHPELCHPFPVSIEASVALEGSAEAALIHNGHWSYWGAAILENAILREGRVSPGPWSDSRAMAYLAARNGYPMVNFMADNQRIAILNKAGQIFLWGHWLQREELGSLRFSNLTWHWRAQFKHYHGPTQVILGGYAEETNGDWSEVCGPTAGPCPHKVTCWPSQVVDSSDERVQRRRFCTGGRQQTCFHTEPCIRFLGHSKNIEQEIEEWWKEKDEKLPEKNEKLLASLTDSEMERMIREVEMDCAPV